MRRRGLTLIETIASLALLSVLAVAAFGWVVTSQKTLAETSEKVEWKRAAHAALLQLHDDLRTGQARIWEDDVLRTWPTIDASGRSEVERIAFRSIAPGSGSVEIVYRFDRESALFTRRIDGRDRVLIGRVASLAIELADPQRDDDVKPRLIAISMASEDGLAVDALVHLGAREISE